MEFEKYKSIENAYQTKHINGQLNRHPEVAGCKWGVQEKIDGSQYSIHITSEDTKFGKRTSFIDHTTGVAFQGDLTVVETDEYKQLIEDVRSLGYEYVILHAELYGEGIQKRIHYCRGKRIRFYDIVVDGQYLSMEDFYNFMDKLGYSQLTVPFIDVYDKLEDAMREPNEYPSKVVEDFEWGEYHVCEGNVIKPYDVACPSLYIKNKNDKFADKMKTKKKKVKLIEDTPDDVVMLMAEFKSYCNENRVLDYFSKEGEISNASEIGSYIKGIQRDMVQSYMSEYKDKHVTFDTKWQKKILGSASKDIVELLRKYL